MAAAQHKKKLYDEYLNHEAQKQRVADAKQKIITELDDHTQHAYKQMKQHLS